SCNFLAIRRNAIANARIFSFDISYSKITLMENESIDIDAYEDFKIHHNNITSLVTNSIKIRSTHTVEFSNNDIQEIHTHAFRIKSESQVKFAHNMIHVLKKEAFTEIKPWQGEEAASITFLANTIMKAEPLSCILNKNYPQHEITIQDNRFKVHCDCNVTDYFKPLLGMNENSTHTLKTIFEAAMAKTLCQDSEVSSRFINIKEYINTNCTTPNLAVISSVTIAVILLLLIIVVFIVCQIKVKKAQDQANFIGDACSTSSFSTSGTPPPQPPVSSSYTMPMDFSKQIVVPDVKTYQQTEVLFPYEKADPISVSDSCLDKDLMPDYDPLQHSRVSCPFN
ncbi:unnamed protein product, partial [Meganyctiphanes norvegica]